MIDEDSIEDAVYSLWQLAMAMASIKHLYRTGHIMDKIEIDDLVTDVDTEEVSINDGLENLEESDTEESIFITELLQHDNDTQTNSDYAMTDFKTSEDVSTALSKACNELSDDTQRQFISSTLDLSGQQSNVVAGFNRTESPDIFEEMGGQHEIISNAPDSEIKVEIEEHLESANEDEKWFSSMVAHLVPVPDIPIEYSDIPSSMVSHMIVKDQEWLTEESTDISMQTHHVFGIEHKEVENNENLRTTNEFIMSKEVENERTEEINPHDGHIALHSMPGINNDEKDNFEGDRSNFNVTISPHQVSSNTNNDKIGTSCYHDIDMTDDKRVNSMRSKDVIEKDSNRDTSTGMLTKSISKSKSASSESEVEYENNQDDKSEPSEIQLDIINATSSETSGSFMNSYEGDKNDWFYKDIQKDKHEGEINKNVKHETKSLQMKSEDNIDITEAQIMTNVKGVEFKSCIVLHQHFEDTGLNTTEAIKDCKKYKNKAKSQPIDNVKVEKYEGRNMIDKDAEEKELITNTKDHKTEILAENKLSKKKERTVKKSAKTTFNVESKKVSYKIRFKVKLGEDSSKPSTLKYLFNLLGGDSLSQK